MFSRTGRRGGIADDTLNWSIDSEAAYAFSYAVTPTYLRWCDYAVTLDGEISLQHRTQFTASDIHATISFGLPIEPEDSQYGKCRLIG